MAPHRHLFAELSVAEGQVYGICRSRKCFVDFQAFVPQQIIPEALRPQVQSLTLILDNETTHPQTAGKLAAWARTEL